MKNSFRVLKRDLIRLLKTPAALVVVIALVVLPSLYTWFNVIGFWNPYDNTGNMRVCVVNEDTGGTNDLMGEMNLGNQIIDQLHENTQLKWDFVDRETAMDAVNSGSAYAAFVIPSDFTQNLFTILTPNFVQPNLQYYVNEKMNPVSPKVTDAGSTTLDETINSQFVSTVSETIASVLNEQIVNVQGAVNETEDTVNDELAKALDGINNVSTTLESLVDVTGDAQSEASSAKDSLQGAYGDAENLESKLQEISDLANNLQSGLGEFVSKALPAITNANTALSNASATASGSIVNVSNSINTASGDVDKAISVGESLVSMNDTINQQLEDISQLDSLTDEQKQQLQQLITNLGDQNDALSDELKNLQALNENIKDSADKSQSAATQMNTSVQASLNSANSMNSVLFGQSLPQVQQGVSSVGASALELKSAVAKETVLIGQASNVIDELNGTLASAATALTETNNLMSTLAGAVQKIQTDVGVLDTSTALSKLMSQGQIDASKIADFMLSPTQVTTEKLYHLDAYGSAMAPLFISLSLWIGCIMLAVILKLEVDDEGIENLTVKQGWFGRWMLFAILVCLQAAVCVGGCLYLGVQTASVPAFFLTAMFISLVYLTITYTLSSSFAHIGIGLCIIFVFVQIPGGTGLYPVEMTTDFFRSVYPFFPFTYGINALRETIAGFYGNQLGVYLGILALIGASFGLFGIFVRPYLTNLNRLAAKEVAESDILNGEEALVPERRYRIHQMLAAISNHEDFREHAEEGAEKFLRYYPRLKFGAFVAGILVPVALTGVLHIFAHDKVVILTVWLGWLVTIIIYLIVIEYVKNNLEHRAAIGEMSGAEIQEELARRGKKTLANEFHVKGTGLLSQRLAQKIQAAKEAKEASQSSEITQPLDEVPPLRPLDNDEGEENA